MINLSLFFSSDVSLVELGSQYANHNFMCFYNKAMSRENLSLVFATRYDSNRPAQRHKLARVLKFRI